MSSQNSQASAPWRCRCDHRLFASASRPRLQELRFVQFTEISAHTCITNVALATSISALLPTSGRSAISLLSCPLGISQSLSHPTGSRRADAFDPSVDSYLGLMPCELRQEVLASRCFSFGPIPDPLFQVARFTLLAITLETGFTWARSEIRWNMEHSKKVLSALRDGEAQRFRESEREKGEENAHLAPSEHDLGACCLGQSGPHSGCQLP